MGEAIRIDVDHEGCADRSSAALAAAMGRVVGTFDEKEAKALAIANERVRRWAGEELHGLAPCLSLRALHSSDRLRPAFDRIGAARTASLAAA